MCKISTKKLLYTENYANIYTTLSDGTALLTQNEVEKESQEPYYYISLGHTVWDSIFHSTKNSVREQKNTRDGSFCLTSLKFIILGRKIIWNFEQQ